MPSSGVQTCALRSEEHTSELQPHDNFVCRLLLEKKQPLSPSAARRARRPPSRPPHPPAARGLFTAARGGAANTAAVGGGADALLKGLFFKSREPPNHPIQP